MWAFLTYWQTWYELSLFLNWYELSLDTSCHFSSWCELSRDMSCRLIWIVAMPENGADCNSISNLFASCFHNRLLHVLQVYRNQAAGGIRLVLQEHGVSTGIQSLVKSGYDSGCLGWNSTLAWFFRRVPPNFASVDIRFPMLLQSALFLNYHLLLSTFRK